MGGIVEAGSQCFNLLRAGDRSLRSKISRGPLSPPGKGPQLVNNDSPPFPLPDLPLPEVPVGGRLAHFVHQWLRITDNKWVLSIIQEGYKIPFLSHPPLTRHPPVLTADTNRSTILVEVSELLSKNAVERVLNRESPGFYSRIFV